MRGLWKEKKMTLLIDAHCKSTKEQQFNKSEKTRSTRGIKNLKTAEKDGIFKIKRKHYKQKQCSSEWWILK